ncbi:MULTISPECIES: MarR family winged helix-turn-helix transcriptional regulator [Hydrocarboniphaga]|uniref:HTH marR-type domain-containing protein n=1 Tax=Hydrocarboniphaga effusa AP103 TaxID=1172194 RepID=I8I4S4_9GAMM|nr:MULTISPECIES: MarR family transcriptional regulator [Hydrocarboniphaga]EIT71286.1 hypothetical protein WQQ_14230 [Hydrocarboniphaga effusa AP103]MDZ4077750.1 MarR family transcriptional regulator [Hydrocarboniphaga sp.]
MVQHYDAKTFRSNKSLGYLLKVAHARMHECASLAFSEHDLNFMQWIVLTKLREGSARTAGDLCKGMYYDTGAVTRLIDSLEERGYLSRERSRQDRRVVELEVTEAGLEKLDEMTPLAVAKLNEALADFSSAEFAEFTRLIEKLIGGLSRTESELSASELKGSEPKGSAS